MSINRIYIIKCFSKNGNFLKLGYTKNHVKDRLSEFKYRYKIIRVIRHKNALTIERAIHRLMYRNRYKFVEKFEGYTECYPIGYLDEIHNIINDFCDIKPKKEIKPVNFLNSIGKLDYVDISMYSK